MLQESSESGSSVTPRVKESIKKVKTLTTIFKSAHMTYVERIKEGDVRKKEEMDSIIGEADGHLREDKE